MATVEFEPTEDDQDRLLSICEALSEAASQQPGEIEDRLLEVATEVDRQSGRQVAAQAAGKPALMTLVTFLPHGDDDGLEVESAVAISTDPPDDNTDEPYNRDANPRWYLSSSDTVHLGAFVAAIDNTNGGNQNAERLLSLRLRSYLASLAEVSRERVESHLHLADLSPSYLQVLKALPKYNSVGPFRFEVNMDTASGYSTLEFNLMEVRNPGIRGAPASVPPSSAGKARLLITQRAADKDVTIDQSWDLEITDRVNHPELMIKGNFSSRYEGQRTADGEDIITAMTYLCAGLERICNAALKYKKLLDNELPPDDVLSVTEFALVKKFQALKAAGVVEHLPKEVCAIL